MPEQRTLRRNNSANERGYGAQLRRSTSPTALNSYDRRGLQRSTQPIHDRYDVPRPMTGCAEQSPLPWNVIIYNFPGCSAAETSHKVQPQWTLHLAFWRIRARRQNLIPGFEKGTQMFKAFSCSAQTCHLPALTASVRTTSTNASWSRKLSSDIVQTTSRTIVKVRRSTLKIPNTTFSLTLWTDTSKGMTTSTSTLDISNLTRQGDIDILMYGGNINVCRGRIFFDVHIYGWRTCRL